MGERTSEYWQERFRQLEESQHDTSVQTVQEIEQEFRRAEQALDGKINAWYQRFAANNGISMVEARCLLNSDELEEFRWDVQDYIKYGRENGINQQWAKQLENVSAKVHISRLEALKVQTQQEIESCTEIIMIPSMNISQICIHPGITILHTKCSEVSVLAGRCRALIRKRLMTSYISPGRWMDATSRTAFGRIKRS